MIYTYIFYESLEEEINYMHDPRVVHSLDCWLAHSSLLFRFSHQDKCFSIEITEDIEYR